MTGAYLAPALATLRTEVNKAFPKRDKASDGWIGDPKHAARKSDHNPDWTSRPPGVVRALDVDIEPDGRPDLDLRTLLLRATIGDPRVFYVISNGRIYSRTYGWAARVYTGTNPHNKHVHVSLLGDDLTPAAAHDIAYDTRPWLDLSTPKTGTLPPVYLHKIRAAARKPRRALYPANVKRVQRALNARASARLTVDGKYGQQTRNAVAAYQRLLGFRGADADGILGKTSAARLGAHRFRVIAD